MSVEIKELIIRATIVDGSKTNSPSQTLASSEQQEEIISNCVEQVLKILERKKER